MATYQRGTGPIAVKTGPALHSMRRVKSQAELELMRIAAAISRSPQLCTEITEPGRYEYEIRRWSGCFAYGVG